jgi:signal transduction histidine kinase
MAAAGATLCRVEATRAADHQKQVLVLYATRRDAQIVVVGDRVIPEVLKQGLAGGLDYYSEHIDPARFEDAQYRTAFNDFLRLKYKGRRFDLVIGMDDLTLDFMDRTRNELFRDVPVVFFANAQPTRRITNSTGVIVERDLRGTVALALGLQPDLQHVFVVSGAGSGDKEYEQQARAQFRSFEPRLAFTYLSGLPTKELEARLATLPDHSIVYYLIVSRDGAGENFHPLDYVDRVTKVAAAPTYCWVDSAINHGIVGGSLKSQESEARAVARLGLRVLNGEPADGIPVSTSDLSVGQVDWRELQRWGISEARVPAGTLVQFREPPVWHTYKLYIAGAAALLLAEAALIAGLLVQRSRRRRAEAKLIESQTEVHVAHVRTLDAQEAERIRIARELHDDIGQRMAVLTMAIDTLSERFPVAKTDTRVRALSMQALELAKDIQAISRTLHSSKLDYLGLVSASASFCRDLSEQQKVGVDFRSHDVPDDVPKEVAICLFRVLQEAVNNAVKHSGADQVQVTLQVDEREIRLDVVDEGIGFDPAAAKLGAGLGLISMKERVGLLAGEIVIQSRAGGGTTVRARVPLSPGRVPYPVAMASERPD